MGNTWIDIEDDIKFKEGNVGLNSYLNLLAQEKGSSFHFVELSLHDDRGTRAYRPNSNDY